MQIYWRTAEPFAAIPGGPAWTGNAYASVVAPAGTGDALKPEQSVEDAVCDTGDDDTDDEFEPEPAARTTGRRSMRARHGATAAAAKPAAHFKKTVASRHKFTDASRAAILRAVSENRCKATASKKNPYGIMWAHIERRVLQRGDYPALLRHWATPGSKNVSRYFYKNLLDTPYFNAARVWK